MELGLLQCSHIRSQRKSSSGSCTTPAYRDKGAQLVGAELWDLVLLWEESGNLCICVCPYLAVFLLKMDPGVSCALREANDKGVPEENLASWKVQNENIRQMVLET